MKHIISIILLALAAAVPATIHAQNPEPLSKKERKEVVKSITSDYIAWHKAGWTGKLKSDMLPLSPTIKVYMERGSLILISVRAPLVGEVVRIEADKDQLLLVNKMKKCYTPLSLKGKENWLAMGQSLLLGRMVVVGSGELSASDSNHLTIYDMGGDTSSDAGYLIVPESPWDSISYGYSAGSDGRITNAMLNVLKSAVESLSGSGVAVESAEYVTLAEANVEWRGSKAVADISANWDNKVYGIEIVSDGVEYGVKGFERIQLGDKYRRVSLAEVIKF